MVALFDEPQSQPGGRNPDFHPLAVESARHRDSHPHDPLRQLGGRALERPEGGFGLGGVGGSLPAQPFEQFDEGEGVLGRLFQDLGADPEEQDAAECFAARFELAEGGGDRHESVRTAEGQVRSTQLEECNRRGDGRADKAIGHARRGVMACRHRQVQLGEGLITVPHALGGDVTEKVARRGAWEIAGWGVDHAAKGSPATPLRILYSFNGYIHEGGEGYLPFCCAFENDVLVRCHA